MQPSHDRTTRSIASPGHKRILLVSPCPHFPPERGGNQRTYLLWKALSEIAPVDVILCDELGFETNITAPTIPASMNFLGRFPWRSNEHSICRVLKKSTPLSRTARRMLRVALPRNWDYEVDRRLKRNLSDLLGLDEYFMVVGRYLKPIVKTGLVGRIPCLLDIDDVDFDIFAQRAQEPARPGWQRLLYSAQSSQIKAAFEKWVPQFDGVWVAKAADTRYSVTRDAMILPNIPYNPPAFAPLPNGSRSTVPIILTVGFLAYLPNREGIDRFLGEGWPKVRAACPTAEYWLAGKSDPAFARKWKSVPGVKLLGFVEDLASVYKASWFTLCPIWTGAGTNIKLLESLAFARTCVSSATAHRGFEDRLQSGDSLLVAANPQELAKACIYLINDQVRRVTLGKRGREVVEREFSYETFVSVVHREIERVLRVQLCKSNRRDQDLHFDPAEKLKTTSPSGPLC